MRLERGTAIEINHKPHNTLLSHDLNRLQQNSDLFLIFFNTLVIILQELLQNREKCKLNCETNLLTEAKVK